MGSLLALLRDHGVDADEAELVEAAEAGLGWVLTATGTTGLPAAEAALLDAAGLPEAPGAYAASATAATGAFAALAATSLTVAEAAQRLGVTEGRVRHKIGRGDLYALPTGRRRLPLWQFTPTGTLPGLAAVVRALPADEHPLAVLAFMTTPQPELEVQGRAVTPEQWLLAGGDPEPVAALASAGPA